MIFFSYLGPLPLGMQKLSWTLLLFLPFLDMNSTQVLDMDGTAVFSPCSPRSSLMLVERKEEIMTGYQGSFVPTIDSGGLDANLKTVGEVETSWTLKMGNKSP